MWNLDIENIRGIHSGTVTIRAGVNTVQASNWQGKSSLIGAVQAVMGTETPLQDGAEHGRVRLETGGDTETEEVYVVEFERRGGSVVRTGTPYLTSERARTLADLFAFLDETNPIRRAVRRGPRDDRGDQTLTDLLLRPVGLEDVESQVRSLQRRRDRLTDDYQEAKRAANRLAETQATVTEHEQRLAELREELDRLRGDENASGEQAELRETLREKQGQKERLERKIDRKENRITGLEESIDDRRAELEDLDVAEVPELDRDRDDLTAEIERIEGQLDVLRDLLRANQRVTDQGHVDLVTDVSVSSDSLTEGDQFACWVCGNDTTEAAVADRLGVLRGLVDDREERLADLQDSVDRIERRRQQRERQQNRKRQLQREIRSLEDDLDAERAELEDARDQLATVTDRTEELDDRLVASDDRRTEVESEIGRVETRLENARDELEELEATAGEREDLRAEIDDLSEEITRLRTRRREQIEGLVDEIQVAIDDVTASFGPSFETVRVDKFTDDDGRVTDLQLTVVRDGGEVDVSALSEGEAELLGFLFAVAGYRAFDVESVVPCILVDEVGGLAAEHLRTLVEYLTEQTEYLVTTAYPEAGDLGDYTITTQEWDVVSDPTPPAR